VHFATSWVNSSINTTTGTAFGLVYCNAVTPITDLVCAFFDLMQPVFEKSWKVLENEFFESWKTLEFGLYKSWKVLEKGTVMSVRTLVNQYI